MQDGAPAHAARRTMEDLDRRGIRILDWPPYSPDLNPIENVWKLMKDHIQEFFPDVDGVARVSAGRLQQAIEEAWSLITSDELDHLVRSMPARCQAVIAADGRHTKY